jgi:hypothetical protein
MKTYGGVDVYIHIFLTSALEVSGQLHAPAALPLGKSPRYPFYRRLGGPQSWSGWYGEVNIFDPTGTRTPAPLVVQPVASHYTDWAIPAPLHSFTNRYYSKGEKVGNTEDWNMRKKKLA